MCGKTKAQQDDSLRYLERGVGSGKFRMCLPDDWKKASEAFRHAEKVHGRTRTSRELRILAGATLTLYHETDEKAAQAILDSGTMLRGKHGLVGGAIYFAATEGAARKKAHRHGVMLKCRVKIGFPKRVSSKGDRTITFTTLKHQGFDSVIMLRKSGAEFAVYSYDQIIKIKRCSNHPPNTLPPD